MDIIKKKSKYLVTQNYGNGVVDDIGILMAYNDEEAYEEAKKIMRNHDCLHVMNIDNVTDWVYF